MRQNITTRHIAAKPIFRPVGTFAEALGAALADTPKLARTFELFFLRSLPQDQCAIIMGVHFWRMADNIKAVQTQAQWLLVEVLGLHQYAEISIEDLKVILGGMWTNATPEGIAERWTLFDSEAETEEMAREIYRSAALEAAKPPVRPKAGTFAETLDAALADTPELVRTLELVYIRCLRSLECGIVLGVSQGQLSQNVRAVQTQARALLVSELLTDISVRDLKLMLCKQGTDTI